MNKMRPTSSRTAAVILLLLMAVTIWWWQSEKPVAPSAGSEAVTNPKGMQSSPSSTPEEKGPPSARGKRPDLPKGSSGPALPEIQGEVMASSAVHTRIPLGHSMVTGGYVTEEGHHEFVVVTPTWLETPSGAKQLMVKSTILNVDQEALVSTGLKSLVNGEQKTQQNAEVWDPDDVTRTLTDTKGLNLLSSPSVVITPGSSAQVRMGNGKASFMLDLVGDKAPDGGFELKSEIKRVE